MKHTQQNYINGVNAQCRKDQIENKNEFADVKFIYQILELEHNGTRFLDLLLTHFMWLCRVILFSLDLKMESYFYC